VDGLKKAKKDRFALDYQFEVSVFLRKTETSNALALAMAPKAEALDSSLKPSFKN
jgi:hypothetical protein